MTAVVEDSGAVSPNTVVSEFFAVDWGKQPPGSIRGMATKPRQALAKTLEFLEAPVSGRDDDRQHANDKDRAAMCILALRLSTERAAFHWRRGRAIKGQVSHLAPGLEQLSHAFVGSIVWKREYEPGDQPSVMITKC